MIAGLLLPAIIGSFATTLLKQEQMQRELEGSLHDKLILLSNSLINPVWNYDMESVRTIVDAAFLDPQLLRLTITTVSDQKGPFYTLEQPAPSDARRMTARQVLVRGGELMGELEMEIDGHQKWHEFLETRYTNFFISFIQFFLALGMLMIAIQRRVLKPLGNLSEFSTQLAEGNLDAVLKWRRADEIGQLAAQMDQMRLNLRESFAEQNAILNNVQTGVLFIRRQYVHFANMRAEQIFGYEPGQMRGLKISQLHLSKAHYNEFRGRIRGRLTDSSCGYEEELCLRRFDGSEFWAWVRGSILYQASPSAGQIWVISDISMRKESEAQINNLAFYDPLTGLPNRRLLSDRLKQALSAYARKESNGALLFIDLDHFKMVNDMYGHGVGDLLLKEVANRLTHCVRESDTVARQGGDEFVVILDNLSKLHRETGDQARIVGEKIIEALGRPYLIDGKECKSSPSIGISVFDGSNADVTVDDLFKQADMALYQAKAAGRNTLRFFDREMQATVMERAKLEGDMRAAISEGQFQLYYQAQVENGEKIVGVEALLRWIHPERGMVSPVKFIPLAEESGLILPLGQWVLETACKQLVAWEKQADMAHVSIAVNVSAQQLHHRDFVQQVWSTIERTGANPQRLKLELTESYLVSDVETVIAKMTILKNFGLSFSLDDFGTGYSSLAYLKRLPLDQLKIDQSFVADILDSQDDAAIARMVIALAGSLELSVIAEGVETEDQRDSLARMGCHFCQGYLFSRPLPLHAFEELARNF